MTKTLLSAFFCAIALRAMALTQICNVTFKPDQYAADLLNGEYVGVNFSYSTDEPGGVYIHALPRSSGSLSPGVSLSPAEIAVGTGVSARFFTINSGTVLVDEVEIAVYASDNSTLLQSFKVPVRFRFGNISVNTFHFSHEQQPASFLLGEQFSTTFNHDIHYPGGVRIFIRPYTGSFPTPGYTASPSAVYSGAGAISADFTIQSGRNVHVDALKVIITDATQSVTLDEFSLPVNLYFSSVKLGDFSPQSGNFPYNNEQRSVDFSYSTTESSGVRIFARPWTNGGYSSYYSASGSPLYSGSGGGSGTFTITQGNQRVDELRFIATTADQSEILLEMSIPVEYCFGQFLVENLLFCAPSPAKLPNGGRVYLNYGLYNDEGQDTRVLVRPFTNGSLSPGYGASGSPLYGVGTSTTFDFFTILSGHVVVDQVQIQVTNADFSAVLAEYYVPVWYEFGNDLSTEASDRRDAVTEWTLSPNPATYEVLLTIRLQAPARIHVYLTDINGKTVADVGNIDVPANQDWLQRIETGGIPTGLYLVVLEYGGKKEVKRVVKI